MSPSHQVISPGVRDIVAVPPVFVYRFRGVSILIAILLCAHNASAAPKITSHAQGDIEMYLRQTEKQHASEDRLQTQSMAFLLRSALAHEEENAELAHKSLRHAWSLSHASPSIAVRLAYEALEMNDIQDAQSILRQTAALCPRDHSLKIHQAIISLRYQSNPRMALEYAESAYRLSPSNPRSIQILTETLSDLGNLGRIEQLLTACATVPSQDPDFWTDTSENFAKNLFTEGELPHPQTLARFNTLLKRSISAGMRSPSHTEKNADICVRSGQLPEAILLYQQSLDIAQNVPAQRRAATNHKLARAFLSLDRHHDALAAASQAVALDNSNPAHFELRADIHLEQRNWALALTDISRSAELDPESLELQVRAANLEIKLREFESAANRCRMVSESFPSAPTPKILRAIALASQGRHHEAVAQLDAAESLLTESEQASIGPEILFPLGVAAEKAGLQDKAVSLLQKCIAQESDLAPEASNHLAFMWIDANSNLEEAGQLIRNAIQANPASPYYRDTFGWWLFKTGHSKAALSELLQALKAMPVPDMPDVHHHLAEVYLNLHDVFNAAIHLKAVAEARPDTPGLEEQIESLRIAHPDIR